MVKIEQMDDGVLGTLGAQKWSKRVKDKTKFFFVQLHYKLTRFQSLQVLVAKMCRDGRGQRCAEMVEGRCGRDGMGT